jgi:flagellar biosynthesis GTPase FlhF
MDYEIIDLITSSEDDSDTEVYEEESKSSINNRKTMDEKEQEVSEEEKQKEREDEKQKEREEESSQNYLRKKRKSRNEEAMKEMEENRKRHKGSATPNSEVYFDYSDHALLLGISDSVDFLSSLKSIVNRKADVRWLIDLTKRKTLLHHAAEYLEEELIYYLVEEGASVNACDISGRTALYYVIHECTNSNMSVVCSIVRYLLSKGADPKIPYSDVYDNPKYHRENTVVEFVEEYYEGTELSELFK